MRAGGRSGRSAFPCGRLPSFHRVGARRWRSRNGHDGRGLRAGLYYRRMVADMEAPPVLLKGFWRRFSCVPRHALQLEKFANLGIEWRYFFACRFGVSQVIGET